MGCKNEARTRKRVHELALLGLLVEKEAGGGRRRFGNRVAGLRTTYELPWTTAAQIDELLAANGVANPSRTSSV